MESKGVFYYIQMLLIGTFIGAFIGGIIITSNLYGAMIGGICTGITLTLTIYLCDKYKYQKTSDFIIYGIAGVIPGGLIGGNTTLGLGVIGTFIGMIIFLCLFGTISVTLIARQKANSIYLSFKGEPLYYTLSSFIGVWLGYLFASLIVNNLVTGSHIHIWQAIIQFFVPFFLSLFFSFSSGFLLAANLKRPILGAVFTFTSSSLVLWIGIDIAPMLFLPGSGLLWAGLFIGSLLLTMSVMALVFPAMNMFIGSLIIVLSILSFVGAVGGLIIGGVLGIIGGAFIIGWKGNDEITSKQLAEAKETKLAQSVIYVHEKMIAAGKDEV
ncbi:DUF6114 domain-containing protein [Alkalihalobacterium elongatum]|uniref:DUF6114 domain-containing protein n=1 Tax=Alkalihalobacterium elongatum TaxID=2675466 RepID=UPI001C1FE504|nr:DUF6114 domain-containing protein [Alkalihalobacterium elongatum]